jgi:uncharacterized protein (TIGR02594 family)
MSVRVALKDDPKYLKAAFSVLGLSEIAGPEHESRVVAMYAACGHPEIKRDEVAWCAAYVGWALTQGGLPTSLPIATNLLASSYLKYPGKRFTKDDVIPRGALCIWPRDAGSGHVNFALADLGNVIVCIGGNQGNGRGGGVTIVSYPKKLLRAAILPRVAKPAPKPVPKPEPLPPPPDVPPIEEEPPAPKPQPDEPPVEAPPEREKNSSLLGKIAGVLSTLTGLSFLSYLTDWQIVVALTLCGLLVAGITFGFFVALFGLDRVRVWIRRKARQ